MIRWNGQRKSENVIDKGDSNEAKYVDTLENQLINNKNEYIFISTIQIYIC